MAFELSSKNIRLTGTTLAADCQKANGSWTSSSLDLNAYIGNDGNGNFDTNGSNFSSRASRVEYQGGFLRAVLQDGNGSMFREQLLNLNAFIQNIDGVLTFQRPSERIIYSTCCLQLQNTTLVGLVMAPDGKFYQSSIDLNAYYANKNGAFVSDDKNFIMTANPGSIQLDLSSGNAILRAQLMDWDHNYKTAEIDLGICVLNKNRRLIFEKHDGLFDRDGFLAKFFERIPFVGFIVAGIHALAGNADYARRALAYCANSTIVCTGIIIGTVVGGPGGAVLGAVLGAAITTPVGVFAEKLISTTVTDPTLRAQVEEATVGRIIYETIKNICAAGTGAFVGNFLKNIAAEALETAGKQIATILGKAAGTSGSTTSSTFVKKLSDALIKDQLPPDWAQSDPNQQHDVAKREVKMHGGKQRHQGNNAGKGNAGQTPPNAQAGSQSQETQGKGHKSGGEKGHGHKGGHKGDKATAPQTT